MSKSIKILVADDEPIGRQLLEAILMPEGYTLLFSEDGQQAIDAAIRELPDIILLDVMMPKLDGFEVCRKLRQDESTAHIPVYLITALDDRDSRIRGIDAGADDYISKPFDRVEILGKIKNRTNPMRIRKTLTGDAQAPPRADEGTSSTSLLLTALIDRLIQPDPPSENVWLVRPAEKTGSKHALFEFESTDSHIYLILSNKLTGTEAALANCIFAETSKDLLGKGSVTPASLLKKTLPIVNNLAKTRKAESLLSADFATVILQKRREENEVSVSGLNQIIFVCQQDDPHNPGHEPACQSFYLQGNQDLKFSLPASMIIFSPDISQPSSAQQELLKFINDLKEKPPEEFKNQNLKKFNQNNDFFVVKLTL